MVESRSFPRVKPETISKVMRDSHDFRAFVGDVIPRIAEKDPLLFALMAGARENNELPAIAAYGAAITWAALDAEDAELPPSMIEPMITSAEGNPDVYMDENPNLMWLINEIGIQLGNSGFMTWSMVVYQAKRAGFFNAPREIS
jgi:hypothetical protein